MAVFLRILFWVLTIVTCATVMFCAYQIETPLAMQWPMEEIAVWGSVLALACAIGLFFAMPATTNGRIGLLVALAIVGFAVWCGFHALEQSRFLYERKELTVTIESAPDEEGNVHKSVVGGPLFIPRNGVELPVALLMPDASEGSFSRNVYYAKALARRGVAALAYQRTPALSSSLVAPLDMEKRGDDVLHMLDLLDKINALYMRRAGVVGFYENEWLIPFVGQKTNRVNYAVLLAPSGLAPGERAIALMGHQMREAGHSPEDAETATQLVRDLVENLRTGDIGPARASLIQRWDAAAKQPWFAAAGLPPEPPQAGTTGAVAASLSFDPVETWKQVRMPIRIMVGAEDTMSLPETLRERFGKYLADNEKSPWQLEEVPGAGHGLMLGEGADGGEINFPPGFFDSLASWIKTTTQPPSLDAPPAAAPTAP
jgi:pimeloyl-ACP methyl ester carboxylesterase